MLGLVGHRAPGVPGVVWHRAPGGAGCLRAGRGVRLLWRL